MPRQLIVAECSPPLRRSVIAVSKKRKLQLQTTAFPRSTPGDAFGRPLTTTGE
jgi:hypothetical protein